MNSAYSLFKRPSTIQMLSLFWKRFYGIPGAGHYTPNLAQEINLSRIQRQLIADKGSFDGGLVLAGIADTRLGFDSPQGKTGSIPSRATFRAALPERRINVDRVSIRKGAADADVTNRYQLCGELSRPPPAVRDSRGVGRPIIGVRPPFTNADSYSRYCLCVLTSQLGKYRTTSSPQVEHRGRELEQWDKPLCASVPALHGSIGSDKRDERD